MNGVTLFEEGHEGQMLRIFLGESDQSHGIPAHEKIVQAARKAGLAGATIFRGSAGYGANSVIHRPHLFRLSSDLPIVVEIVDEPEKVQAFLPVLKTLLEGRGLVTLERVMILHYATGEGAR
jgi:PII-like signaling protein